MMYILSGWVEMIRFLLCTSITHTRTHIHKYHSFIRKIQKTKQHELQVWILCNDCNDTTEVYFHIIGHKCGHCSSYNTRAIAPPVLPQWPDSCCSGNRSCKAVNLSFYSIIIEPFLTHHQNWWYIVPLKLFIDYSSSIKWSG